MGHEDSQHLLSIYYLNAMHCSNCTSFSNPRRYYYYLEIRNMKYRGTILLDPNYTTNKWELRLCGFSAHTAAAAPAKSLQSCPTLCDPVESSPPGSAIPGILQARILEWVAMPSSRGSSWPRDQTCISCGSCIGRRILYHWVTWEALRFAHVKSPNGQEANINIMPALQLRKPSSKALQQCSSYHWVSQSRHY